MADDKPGHPMHLWDGTLGIGLGEKDHQQHAEVLDRGEILKVRLLPAGRQAV